MRTQIDRIHIKLKNRTWLSARIIVADKTNGKTQYPNTQTDWKKLIVPPRSFAFSVTTAEPIHMEQNTYANTPDAWLAGARMDNRMERFASYEENIINGFPTGVNDIT